MKRFIEDVDRSRGTLFPKCLEDRIEADNPVRVIAVVVDECTTSGNITGDIILQSIEQAPTNLPASAGKGLVSPSSAKA